jgi:hypothetical protein
MLHHWLFKINILPNIGLNQCWVGILILVDIQIGYWYYFFSNWALGMNMNIDMFME